MFQTLLILIAMTVISVSLVATLMGVVVATAHKTENFHLSQAVLQVLARDTLARVVFTSIRPFSLLLRDDSRATVWLIVDAQHSTTHFALMASFLRQRDYTVRIIQLKGAKSTLSTRAEQLSRLLKSAKLGDNELTIIAFDTAGIVAGWAFKHLDIGHICRQMITIGTPWQGTQMAVFGRTIASSEPKYRSPKLDSLNEIPTTITAIWSPDDPQIVPPQSACAVGDYQAAIAGTGHLGLLLSSRVMRSVLEALRRP